MIETDRLVLRPHGLGDLDDLVAIGADPVVMRFLGGASNPEETWQRLLRWAGHWALLGYGNFCVREKATGRFVGNVGFLQFRRGISPVCEGLVEVGWVLAGWCHGKGYATEAAGVCLAWSDTKWPGEPTVCMIDPRNSGSLNVAGKLGFSRVDEATYKGHPVVLLKR